MLQTGCSDTCYFNIVKYLKYNFILVVAVA